MSTTGWVVLGVVVVIVIWVIKVANIVNGADSPYGDRRAMQMAKAKRRTRARRATVDLLENVLASLRDAVVLTDEDDRVAMLNPAAEELTGLAEAQALHRPCADVFVGTPTIAAMVRRARVSRQDESCGEETLVMGPRRFPVRLSCSPVWGEHDQVRGTALVIQDLSYQKKLEDEARRNREELIRWFTASGVALLDEGRRL